MARFFRGIKESCGKEGQTRSGACPSLAQKLLKAVRKHANSAQSKAFLDQHATAHVLHMSGKPKKTLKRRSRGKAWHKLPKNRQNHLKNMYHDPGSGSVGKIV